MGAGARVEVGVLTAVKVWIGMPSLIKSPPASEFLAIKRRLQQMHSPAI